MPAGPVSFAIANKGASRVTETEIMQDGRILGERENLTPGLSGRLSLRLEPGQYVVYCPNAKSRPGLAHRHRHGAAPRPTRR